MIDAMLPILRALYEARDEAAVADCLLRMPDAIVLKYQRPIEASCQRAGFAKGVEFVALRVALMMAVRNSDGGLPGGPAMALYGAQVKMVAIAAGASLDPERIANIEALAAGAAPKALDI